MATTVGIIQSNYIPWKGYFDFINKVDAFVLLDDVQYTKRDWRNRNRIKTPQGVQWISIPVQVKGKYHQKINETRISDPEWGLKHWKILEQNYKKACYFEEYAPIFEELYNQTEPYLSTINFRFIEAINRILGIRTPVLWSSQFEMPEGRNEKLLAICKQLEAQTYVSGPSARGYMDESLFTNNGISIEWMDYSGYPEYEQLYPPFEHNVSILDLIFTVGKESTKYLRTFRSNANA